jgi:2'-5' RNA ligase
LLQAIVAPVPEPHATQIIELWAALHERFNVHSELTQRFPHFSLHVAQQYDVPELRDNLAAFASEYGPLRVRTAGLGIFTRERAVLYMPVVRNPRLNAFHRELWRAASGLGEDVFAYYRPERWIPHMTLAHDKLDQYNLGGAIHWLSDQKLDWVFDISELALIEADGDDKREVFRVPLTGDRVAVPTATPAPARDRRP